MCVCVSTHTRAWLCLVCLCETLYMCFILFLLETMRWSSKYTAAPRCGALRNICTRSVSIYSYTHRIWSLIRIATYNLHRDNNNRATQHTSLLSQCVYKQQQKNKEQTNKFHLALSTNITEKTESICKLIPFRVVSRKQKEKKSSTNIGLPTNWFSAKTNEIEIGKNLHKSGKKHTGPQCTQMVIKHFPQPKCHSINFDIHETTIN